MESKVTVEMNAKLIKQFTKAEVQEILNQMTPLKVLESNGYSARFYQSYRHIAGIEVCLAALKFLNEGVFEKNINYTYIVFIPKIQNHLRASDFRPNGLYNVVNKIVSKALAISLRRSLHPLSQIHKVPLSWDA